MTKIILSESQLRLGKLKTVYENTMIIFKAEIRLNLQVQIIVRFFAL